MKKIIPFIAMSLVMTACQKSSTQQGAASSSGADEIKIGEIGSMTGAEATFGTSTHNGIMLAFETVNAGGGVKGKKLRLISLDDQGKPDEAATATQKLVNQEKVVALLGEVASSRSLAMAPIAQNAKVPMISPSSTNPRVTEMGDYIFRVCFIDPFQGTVMAKFAHEHLKLKKVAILRDVKNDYSVGLADFFTQTFTKLGGEIVADLSYSASDIDFKSQLTAIRSKNPEAIMVPGYYTEVGLIARQAKELGIKAPLLGGDGWDSPKLTEIASGALDGSYFSNHYSVDDQSPHVQSFIQKFKAKYGVVPDGLAAMGFDAAMVLIKALETAPDTSGVALRDALAKTKDFQGVTGKISIDEKRNAVKSAVVLKIEKGAYRFVTTVNP